MVVNTNEERLCTIELIERFLSASVPIEFSASGDDRVRYAHIPQKYAQPINAFYLDTFNAWLNPHRPCLFATSVANAKGKLVKRYKHEDGKTPLECLVQLSAQGLVTLKDGVTLDALQARARTQSELAAAQAMQRTKSDLFASFATPRHPSVTLSLIRPLPRCACQTEELLRNPTTRGPAGSEPQNRHRHALKNPTKPPRPPRLRSPEFL